MDRAGYKRGAVVIIPAFNEEGRTVKVVRGIARNVVDEVVVVDDGSTDNTATEVTEAGATLVRHTKREGIGFAVRTGIRYALKRGFSVIVVMAGNGKDDPRQIPELLEPIMKGKCDYVQGSRYIEGGSYGKMPAHRFLFTKMYSFAVRFLTGFPLTDGTNGFRAYRTSLLKDKRINIDQDWLRESLEYYLSIKVIQLGYRVTEVPVAKIYPTGVSYKRYTKVTPFTGWAKRLAPLFFLSLRLRR